MADFLKQFLRHFSKLLFMGVGLPTRLAWSGEHKAWKALPRARARYVMGLWAVTGILIYPTVSVAQEMAGPTMVVTSESGGSSELPLIAEKVRVTIDQGHASTHFEHTFQNESNRNLEGRYQIHLGAVATATGFSYFNGKDRIVGEIFEREAAARVYETVTGTGRDPGLLEQTGEGTFAFRVAPITPGEKKRVQVSVAQWLRQAEDTVEYHAPLGKTGQGAKITIADSRPITKIWSPTHELSIKDNRGRKEILVGKAASSSAGLVLRYRITEQPFELSTALHRTPGHDAYAVVSISAPGGVPAKRAPRDVTLVVDRSGSMSGEPLTAARRAAEGVIQRLNDSDFVNIISFDDGTQPRFEKPEKVGTVRTQAIEFARAMEAGGGTDLALALKEALNRQTKSGRAQVILFITDGQSDPAQALEAAKKAPSSVRLYTVGIGPGVDRALLSRMARDNRGRFTYVADENNLERDVDHLFSRIESPVLSDVKLELDGATMSRIYPRRAPDLFRKDQLTFAMRLRPQAGKPTARLRVSAKRDGKVQTFDKILNLKPTERPWVGRMWGQNRVDDLLEQMSLSGETDELKKETIELALAYSLVTRYTSFLAIPESEISDAVRGSIDEERARRARILKKHKDAAALSRTLMPPGDPVITVRAPRSAQGVTAVFPFGLTLDLAYDSKLEIWQARFLVPNDVPDGPYDVDIFVVDREGTVSSTKASYEIDSQSPAFEVRTTEELGGVRLSIDADEALREVRVTVEGGKAAKLRVLGVACHPSGCQLERRTKANFVGLLELPPGTHRLRVIVTDKARNESVRVIEVTVPEEGC